MIFPAQIRAARALLNISQRQLAEASGIGIATIKRLETRNGIAGAARTIARLQEILESQGVDFVDQDELAGPGVRLAKRLQM